MLKRALSWLYPTPSNLPKVPREEAAAPALGHRENLSKEGALFLRAVKGRVTLVHTARSFPHIINKLAMFQHKPSTMVRAIDQLLVVEEARNRGGFPFEVVEELTDLKAICERVWQSTHG